MLTGSNTASTTRPTDLNDAMPSSGGESPANTGATTTLASIALQIQDQQLCQRVEELGRERRRLLAEDHAACEFVTRDEQAWSAETQSTLPQPFGQQSLHKDIGAHAMPCGYDAFDMIYSVPPLTKLAKMALEGDAGREEYGALKRKLRLLWTEQNKLTYDKYIPELQAHCQQTVPHCKVANRCLRDKPAVIQIETTFRAIMKIALQPRSECRGYYDRGQLVINAHRPDCQHGGMLWYHVGVGNLNTNIFTLLQLCLRDPVHQAIAAAFGNIALEVKPNDTAGYVDAYTALEPAVELGGAWKIAFYITDQSSRDVDIFAPGLNIEVSKLDLVDAPLYGPNDDAPRRLPIALPRAPSAPKQTQPGPMPLANDDKTDEYGFSIGALGRVLRDMEQCQVHIAAAKWGASESEDEGEPSAGSAPPAAIPSAPSAPSSSSGAPPSALALVPAEPRDEPPPRKVRKKDNQIYFDVPGGMLVYDVAEQSLSAHCRTIVISPAILAGAIALFDLTEQGGQVKADQSVSSSLGWPIPADTRTGYSMVALAAEAIFSLWRIGKPSTERAELQLDARFLLAIRASASKGDRQGKMTMSQKTFAEHNVDSVQCTDLVPCWIV